MRCVVIAGVLRGSPAQRQGLEAGDVLVGVNGKAVSDPRGTVAAIAAVAPGERVRLSVVRAGRTQEVEVTVGQRPTPAEN